MHVCNNDNQIKKYQLEKKWGLREIFRVTGGRKGMKIVVQLYFN